MLEGPYRDWRDQQPHWGKHRIFDQQRKYVVYLAAETYQHPFRDAAKITEFRPKYNVPGRRRNGSHVGKHRVRWFLGRIALPLRDIALTLIQLPLLVVDEGDTVATWRRGVVHGRADCAALGFADANSSEQQQVRVDTLWLIWSHRRALLAKVVEEPEPHIAIQWQADENALPAIDPDQRIIRWRDGSSVAFDDYNWAH